jgi:hypothetical protein
LRGKSSGSQPDNTIQLQTARLSISLPTPSGEVALTVSVDDATITPMIAKAGFDQPPTTQPQGEASVKLIYRDDRWTQVDLAPFVEFLIRKLWVILFWLTFWWIPLLGLSIGIAIRFAVWASSTQ